MKFLSGALCALATFATMAQAAPNRILVLTDSHGVGPFGSRLLEQLRVLPGASVDIHAVGGSAPHWFERGTFSKCGLSAHADNHTPAPKFKCGPVHTPLLKNVLQGMENGLVIVELGSNLIGEKNPFVENTTRKMVESIQRAGARCLWVGPPKMRRFTDQAIARNVEQMMPALIGDSRYPRCDFIDSRPLTSYPATGGDGVHFSFPAGAPIARAWADEIARAASSIK